MFKLGKQRFTAAVFDLDGTLIDSNGVHKAARLDIIKRISTDATGGINLNHAQEMFSFKAGNKGATYMDFVAYFLKKYKIDISLSDFLTQYESTIFTNLAKLPYRPEADKMLRFLRERGIPTALATSSDRQEVFSVASSPDIKKALPFEEAFDFIITGDDVEKKKPHKHPYRDAMRKLGVLPCGTFSLEDTKAGIQSALSARIPRENIASIYDRHSNDDRAWIDRMSGFQFKNHTEILDLLERSN